MHTLSSSFSFTFSFSLSFSPSLSLSLSTHTRTHSCRAFSSKSPAVGMVIACITTAFPDGALCGVSTECHVHTHTHTHTYMREQVCVCVCAHACACACVGVPVPVRMRMCVGVCECVCAWLCPKVAFIEHTRVKTHTSIGWRRRQYDASPGVLTRSCSFQQTGN